MNTGKTIALTRWTFVDKIMSLLFNMLSRLVIIFLPRSKRLLISWLQLPSAVILEPQKIKSDTFHCFPIYFPWSDGTRCHFMPLLMPWTSFSECLALSQLFHSSLSLSSRGFLALFTFCHKGGVICISEVIDISPSNLDSSFCFFQSSVSHDVLCTEVK